MTSGTEISDVTDTAIWVAAYRSEESERKDALFHDNFAKLLIGTHGESLARRTQGSRYTAWSVVIRTYLIDQFIEELLIQKNITTVLNLGAGLDTRPYRLKLPQSLRWIEVDFPKIIEHKNENLKDENPQCSLLRVSLDLSNEELREDFLKNISRESGSVLVLTEGVIPYLSNEEAESLAKALYRQGNFTHWISEYYSPEILKFLRTPKRLKQMENAPFLFYPKDWFGFFREHGWKVLKTKYFGLESEKLGRTPPTPGWLKGSELQSDHEAVKTFLGYTIFEREA